MDTENCYGRISRALHWMMAAGIAFQLLGMALRNIFGRADFVAPFVRAHAGVGLILLALVVLRVIWALVNRHNRPGHGHGPLARAARLGHGALYALMVAIPAMALLRAFGATRPLAPWGITILPGRSVEIDWAVRLGDALHGVLGWTLAVAIVGHIAMVALHEILWRDGTLRRMTARKSVSR